MTDPRFGQNATQYDALLNVQAQATEQVVFTATGNPLNSNPFFETDTSGWFSFGGGLVRDGAHPYQGSFAGKFTSDNVSQFCGFSSADFTVTPGEKLFLSGALYPTGQATELKVDWYDSGHSRIDQSSLGSTSVFNTYNFMSGLITAFPPNVAFGQITAIMASFPPNTAPFWGDSLMVQRTSASSLATAVLAPHGEVWQINRTAVVASSHVLEATATSYRGLVGDPYVVDSTFSGSSGSTSDTPVTLRDGDTMIVVRTGGDIGATYTVTCNGWRTTPMGGFRGRRV
jgi:hypothetical protein